MCDEQQTQARPLSKEEEDVWRRNGDAISETPEDFESPKGVLSELKEPGVRD